MTRPLLILRPEPGNSASCARAAELGLEAIAMPLFLIEAMNWLAPEPDPYQAVVMTSANAARNAGPAIARFTHLPLYTVGAATSQAALELGFDKVLTGTRDAATLFADLARHGVTRALHVGGADMIDIPTPGIRVDRRIVYANRALPRPAMLNEAVAQHPVIVLHSPRAAKRIAGLVAQRRGLKIAAISAAAASAVGHGWEDLAISPEPSDEALLAVAARLAR